MADTHLEVGKGGATEVTVAFSEARDVPFMLFAVDTDVVLDEVSVLGDILPSARALVLDGLCNDVPLLTPRVSPVLCTLALLPIGPLVWDPWLLPYDAAATARSGFCSAAIGLGGNWLPA